MASYSSRSYLLLCEISWTLYWSYPFFDVWCRLCGRFLSFENDVFVILKTTTATDRFTIAITDLLEGDGRLFRDALFIQFEFLYNFGMPVI